MRRGGEGRDAIEGELGDGARTGSEIEGEATSLGGGGGMGGEEEPEDALRKGVGEGGEAMRDGEATVKDSMVRMKLGDVPENAFNATTACESVMECVRREREGTMVTLDAGETISGDWN